jgi:hypothetical protein
MTCFCTCVKNIYIQKVLSINCIRLKFNYFIILLNKYINECAIQVS